MSLTLPRKFTHGQKAGNVDAYGEVFLWPDGHFQFMVHLRNSNPLSCGRINARFALLDDKHMPLGIYGMPEDQFWSVVGGRHYDELYGKISEDKLRTAHAVALLFRHQPEELDASSLQELATTGSELVLCPVPD